MKHFFDGMLLFEKFALIGGSFLLMSMFFGLLMMLVKEQKIQKRYLFAFFIPVALITFGMKQHSKIHSSFDQIDRLSNELIYPKLNQANYSVKEDEEEKMVQKKLRHLISDISERSISSSEYLSILGKGYFSLGQKSLAVKFANAALNINPNNFRAFNVKKGLNLLPEIPLVEQ